MSEQVWISQHVIYATHDRQITEHGGLPGVRNENLSQSTTKTKE